MRIMTKPFLLLLLAAFCLSGHAQEKTNPIIFIDFFGGLGASDQTVVTGLVDLNLQSGGNLLTARYGETGWIDINAGHKNLHEAGLLYGRRIIKDGHAFSYSAGLSANHYNNSERANGDSNEIGLPFELGIKWFKKEKRKFRLIGIPVGKPTAFGGSFGFKLVGNVSRYSYGSLGITYGLGWHKKYE